MLNWIDHPDPQPDLHDHPVNFVSFILWGGYIERARYNEVRAFSMGDVNRKRFTDPHRIISVLSNTLTLVFYGPRKQTWGYYKPTGWVSWRDYENR